MKEKTVSGLYSAYIMPIKAYERLSVFNFLIYKNIPELMIQQWNGEKKTFASLLLVQRNDSIENLDISSSYSLLQTVTKKTDQFNHIIEDMKNIYSIHKITTFLPCTNVITHFVWFN